MPVVEPAHGVLLLVGREDFTPPRSFGEATCVATHDCLAIGVAASVSVDLSPAPATGTLLPLGEFTVESEGLLSLRSAYSREYDNIGVDAGPVSVAVWGDDAEAPATLAIVVRPAPR